jgi:hypothetical protein
MRRTRLSWAPALWLVLALLLAQALGQWHGTLHARPAAAAPAADAFDQHKAGDPDCRLFDQLLQADGLAFLPPPLLSFGAAPAAAQVALQAARQAPAWRQRARGPPVA